MKDKYIYLFWFISLLPLMILRDFTPNNELRYLSIIDEALRNGNIFTFTNQGEIYADKPPLHFWLMMLGRVILGEHRMWYYSLLSVIPAFVIILTMTKWIRSEIKYNIMVAPLMLMTTGLFIGVTLVVRMDMLMNMFIILSLYSFYEIYNGKNIKFNRWLFPLYIFLALFSKGPYGLLIPLVSTISFLIFKKKLSDFTLYWGCRTLLVLLAGSILWFTGVYFEGGIEYLNDLLVRQTVGRGINSFHHSEPFYYYLISIWYSLAFWAPLVLAVIFVSLKKKKIDSQLEQFFAITILSTLVLLSLVSSKLAIYSLPVIPFLIYLSVLLLYKFDLQQKWLSFTVAFPAILMVMALPALIYLSRTEELQYIGTVFIYISAAVLTITGIISIYNIYLLKKTIKAIYTFSLGFLLAAFIAGWSMPSINAYIGWKDVCLNAKEILEERKLDDCWVYKISRAENMDVYLGKDIIKVNKEDVLNNQSKNKVLLINNKVIETDKEINIALRDKEQHKIGKYIIVLL